MLSNCHLAYSINIDSHFATCWSYQGGSVMLSVSRAWNVFLHGLCACTVPAGLLNEAGIGRTRRGQLCADTALRQAC
jgi:hypothetical protein